MSALPKFEDGPAAPPGRLDGLTKRMHSLIQHAKTQHQRLTDLRVRLLGTPGEPVQGLAVAEAGMDVLPTVDELAELLAKLDLVQCWVDDQITALEEL